MTKTTALLNLMRRKWVSPIVALNECQIFSLSQRCGEFRREGHAVVSRWVETQGARFKEYRITSKG